jgi:hypothetical protein
MRDHPMRAEPLTDCSQAPVADAFGPTGTRILAVEAARLLPGSLLSDRTRSIIVARIAGIDRQFIDRVAPDLVAAPLFAASFDILDLIDRLVKYGYRGRVIALTGLLPSPRAVEDEIRALVGPVDFALVEVTDED